MADEFVKQKLCEWKLENLIENFESEGIEEESFAELNKNNIKELIPRLGERLKFLKKFEEYKSSLQGDKKSGEDTEPITSTSLMLHTNKQNIQSKNKVLCILENSVEGVVILKVYKETQILTTQLRTKLVNLVITHELNNSKDNKISTITFLQICEDIVAIFPTEKKGTYYIPYTQENGKVLQARGKLWCKYYNLRRILKKLNKNSTVNVSDEGSNTDLSEEAIIDDTYEPSDENKDKLQWLKNSKEPWNQIVEFWKSTRRAREIQFKKETLIYDYVESFTCLKQALGYTLIEIDFAQKYPGKELSLFDKWPTYSLKILNIAKSCNRVDIKNCLDILSISDTEETRSIIALRILPLLIPIVSIRRNNNTWRPSKIEIQDGFFIRINTVADLQPTIQRRREKMLKYGLTVQPFIVIIGSSLQRIECSYVVIDKIIYLLENTLKAVDICFKSYHVFSALYPYECEQVWMFFQKVIYNISTKWDKKCRMSVGLTTFISDVENEN